MYCLWEYKIMQPLWEAVWQFLKRFLKKKLPYDPAIPLLGELRTPKRTENICPQKKLYVNVRNGII